MRQTSLPEPQDMRRAGLGHGAQKLTGSPSLGPSPPAEQGLVEMGFKDCRLLPVLVPKYTLRFCHSVWSLNQRACWKCRIPFPAGSYLRSQNLL